MRFLACFLFPDCVCNCWPGCFNITSRRAVKKSQFISYLLQPQRVVLHYVFQVLQLVSRPIAVHGRRVPLHAAGAAILFGLRRRPSALTPVPLRQDEGVAALAVLDAVKPPPFLSASSSSAAIASFPLASSSSCPLRAPDAGCIGDGRPGPKQQQHQEHPGEVQAFHHSSFYCTEVFVLSLERVKRRLLTLWPQFTFKQTSVCRILAQVSARDNPWGQILKVVLFQFKRSPLG